MVKTAPEKPAEININLMPSPESSGTASTAVSWILHTGRYLIIFAEIVAIAIFILSIKLSTDKQFLKSDIKTLTSQVAAQNAFESEFRSVQNKINEIKRLRGAHFPNGPVVAEFLKLLPKGTSLETMQIEDGEISFSGSFGSPKELQTFISSFSTSEKLVGLDISKLETPSEKNPDFTFTASVVINKSAFEGGVNGD